jgi:hypothetical protein
VTPESEGGAAPLASRRVPFRTGPVGGEEIETSGKLTGSLPTGSIQRVLAKIGHCVAPAAETYPPAHAPGP